MNNSPVILIIRCIGCCIRRPDGSINPCNGDFSKCSTCPTDPATLPIDNYLLVLLIFAIMFGFWFFNKEKIKRHFNILLSNILHL